MRWTIILYLLLLSNTVFALPEITSWYNNRTGDDTLDTAIAAEESIYLNVSANETVNWTWTLDGAEQETDMDTNQGAWTYTFPYYGTYRVNVSGVNENGSTQTVSWTITSALNFTDALGNSISITEKPDRIVSLAPSNTEILFALELGDRVVGVTSYCNYPPEATSKEKVGGFSNPSTELVVILEPDLILASSGNDINVVSQLIEECESLNCTLVSLKAETIDKIVENIELVGKIAGVSSESVTSDVTSRINAIESNTASLPEDQKLKVFYTVYQGLYVGGNGTFGNDLIQKAGGVNIASNISGWGIMSKEVLLLSEPDVIICSGMGVSGADICDSIKNDDVLKDIDAVVNNKLYAIGDSNIIERPGPRIASGLETIYAFLNFPQGEVNATSVQITSPQSTSYAYGSTITLSYTSGASTPVSFYRLDDGFVTSFDSDAATVSPGSGSHTITVWVGDANGEWGSDTLSFTIESPPQQPSGSSGGSSAPSKPTVTTSAGEAVVSIPYVGAGSTVSVQIPNAQNVDVTEISFKAKSSVSSAKVTIKSLDVRPEDVSAVDGEAYGYLDISKQNLDDEEIDDLAIKFKVERVWIDDNEVDQEAIKLKRYHNSQWSELLTEKTREDPTYIYFTANSPGFSYFTIEGEKLTPAPTTPAPVETSAPVTSAATTTVPPTTPVTTVPSAMLPTPIETPEEKGICGPTIVALIGTLPMILYCILRSKDYENR